MSERQQEGDHYKFINCQIYRMTLPEKWQRLRRHRESKQTPQESRACVRESESEKCGII